ncbi:MAG: FAD-dependent oxidoreductase, partial [Chitinivibrionales bacterium]|nr:FAD-dependent oxidoreductase [Chitinivibrionales bacterium]
VRAARLGARVTIVEKHNHFGGVASITCTWHKLMSTDDTCQIIAGLTHEVTDRLGQRNALKIILNNHSKGFEFRPGDLKIVLDDLVRESKVTAWLHTMFCAPVVVDGDLVAVLVENKSGRGAIKAKYFIDATGDGDLCARLGLAGYTYRSMLPPTTCAFIDRWPELKGVSIGAELQQHGHEYGIRPDFVWGSLMPGSDVYMLAGTRVNGVDCSDARQLTDAEIEGRRQVAAVMAILAKHHPERAAVLHDFPVSIGIRDTRHISTRYRITADDILYGRRFADAIANGSYRVDIHHQDKPGITLKYLDGTQTYNVPGKPPVPTRWRDETPTNPTWYQIPLRSLIPGRFPNLMLAGRMIDAELEAFGAVRVQVNTNQMGEAAGVASFLALDGDRSVLDLAPTDVRAKLAEGGSIVL